MMEVKFPKRRPDGSFCVEVTLGNNAKSPDLLAVQVTSWLSRWVQVNRYWKTSLFTPEESLDFFDEFAKLPFCTVNASGSISLRLEGRPEAKKRWKDWLILKLLKDLQAKFKEVTSVEGITNCSG